MKAGSIRPRPRVCSLAWQASDTAPNNGVFPQPIVSNGLVYWGSNDGNERATDTSGNPVWKTNLGRTSPPACDNPTDYGISSTPTITTDVPVGGATSVMYVGGGDSKLYALNAATGAVLWSYDVGGNPDTFLWDSPAVFGNSVYIGVASFGDCPLVRGQIVQLNRVTGALQHTYDMVPNGCTGGGLWGSITVDAAAGTLYFATGTPGNCPATPGGPSLIELHASDLSLVGTWTVPVAQQARRPRLRVDTDLVHWRHRRAVDASRRRDQQERHLLRLQARRAFVGTCLEYANRERRWQPGRWRG